eukprot:TRINITY_DN3542_c0_g2_i1.p1 TRINITY_DN3542_c0_g2~~TRINITY_DN3542_c0_g2_i1.p1  ORF type:complete len:600 (-),score=100.99 TRINITY_DN3542_c0_g2_i1:104-1903(-)
MSMDSLFVPGRTTTETLISVSRARIEAENAYATAMETLSTSLGALIDRSPSATMIQCLRSYLSIRAEQSRQLAQSLSLDVLSPTENFNMRFGAEYFALQVEGRKLDIRINELSSSFEVAVNKYSRAMKESEEVKTNNRGVQERADASPIQKFLAAERTFDTQKARRLAETAFKESIDNHNSEVDKLYEQFAKYLEGLERLEESRLKAIQEAIMKSFVFDISFVRNIQYDVDNLTKKLEAFEVKPSQEFFRVFQSEKREEIRSCKRRFEEVEDQIQRSLLARAAQNDRGKSIREYVQSLRLNSKLKSFLDFMEKELPSKLNLREKSPDIERILTRCFEVDNIEESEVVQFRNFMTLAPNKLLFLGYLSNVAQEGRNRLTWPQFDNIRRLLRVALDQASVEGDFGFILRALNISEFFFRKDLLSMPKDPSVTYIGKIFLYTPLIGTPCLQRLELWESVFFTTVSEEIEAEGKLNPGQKKNSAKDEGLMFNNLLISALNRVIKRMLYFEVEKVDLMRFVSSISQVFFLDQNVQTALTEMIQLSKYPNPDRVLFENEEREQLNIIFNRLSFPQREEEGRRRIFDTMVRSSPMFPSSTKSEDNE